LTDDEKRVLIHFFAEVGCKSFIAFLFLILALVRYKEISTIGTCKTTIYSRLFKGKVSMQLIQFFMEIAIVILYHVSLSEENPNLDPADS
jgi:hypothetical protein